jgi:type I restriction-modification system DNA methylase subunit
MRNFATESGKSKGQFYTPAEVSRILAKVIGIDQATSRNAIVYDPACGSASLLIRAADEAPFRVSIMAIFTDQAGHLLMYVMMEQFHALIFHFVEKQHNDAFISLMDKYMPYWREIKRSLNGQILDFME